LGWVELGSFSLLFICEKDVWIRVYVPARGCKEQQNLFLHFNSNKTNVSTITLYPFQTSNDTHSLPQATVVAVFLDSVEARKERIERRYPNASEQIRLAMAPRNEDDGAHTDDEVNHHTHVEMAESNVESVRILDQQTKSEKSTNPTLKSANATNATSDAALRSNIRGAPSAKTSTSCTIL
jgi:hypothetical protein